MDQWLKSIEAFAGKITVRSAVNPLLWLCAVVSLPCLYLYAQTGKIFFAVLASFPIAAVLFAYFYFLCTNPDYLRSEDYQLRRHSLEMLGDKDNRLGANASTIVAVTNPALPSENQSQSGL